MVTIGNRRNGFPVLVRDGQTKYLERIPLNEKVFNEDWIQNLIHENPHVLPITEIESGFSPLIPIGREIQTPAGYIDNLYISPEGYLTIVETKLWRNPEARREVVGQVIDYAKEINKWSFTDLDNCTRLFNQLYNNNSDGLLATVRRHTELDENDETYFIDNISKNIKKGRFLLLIVGDGIRESVEEMVDYLTLTPQLYFTLALVELQVFNLDKNENSKIVIPQLVMRTREVTRAIVRIEGNYSPDLKINIETDLGSGSKQQSTANYRRLGTITAQDYFEELENKTNCDLAEFANTIIKDSEDLGLFIEWNTGSFGVKLLDPLGSGVKISLVNIDRSGLVYPGFSKGQFEKLNLPMEICYSFTGDTAAMLPGVKQNLEKKHIWNKYSTLGELKPVYGQFWERLKKYIDEIRIASEKN